MTGILLISQSIQAYFQGMILISGVLAGAYLAFKLFKNKPLKFEIPRRSKNAASSA